MSAFELPVNALPAGVISLLNEKTINDRLPHLLGSILYACRHIAENIRNSGYSADVVGTQNDFGDHQLHVDIEADNTLFAALKESGLVVMASSEENPTEIACNGSGYSVGFDPLDGSSIVDCNFAVGTILGVWPGDTLLNRTGREQVCSLITMYGPRVTIALAFNGNSTLSGEPFSLELTMHPSCWVVSIPKLTIAPKCKTFAPGNLRATADNPAYKQLVDYWIDNKYTLRYSGGLVPDVYHILIKGGGVLANASSASAKAKLRLLYECAPIALIIEAAGGASCVCSSEVQVHLEPLSLLDVPVSELDKRVGVCYGSIEEVERFKKLLF